MIGRAVLRFFLFPGDLVSNAVGAQAADDRIMIRTLVNMLVWNLVAVLIVVLVW
ncbi:MAG TPA: hypothetical protein VLI93_01700 [Acetobacteraceae bacterium]|nr:hypothetical protein [Acetobacteraceae bacterium]